MVQLLVPNPQSNVMHFLYVLLPDFGCPLTALSPLHGFKLLQPVAGRHNVCPSMELDPRKRNPVLPRCPVTTGLRPFGCGRWTGNERYVERSGAAGRNDDREEFDRMAERVFRLSLERWEAI